MNRHLRSHLDRLIPDISQCVELRQNKQAEHHDNCKPLRIYSTGDTVFVRDFSTPTTTWLPGIVTKVTGPLSYHVELDTGRTVRRHVDAIRNRTVSVQSREKSTTDDDLYLPDVPPVTATVPPVTTAQPRTRLSCSADSRSRSTIRQSTRHYPPPDRFGW